MLINELNIFLVGGAVRDELLGRKVTEKDWVVVGATPQQMLDLGFKVVGKDFPVFLHPKTKEEYALARTEKKTGHGYGGFSFNASSKVSLEEDLKRRDLTINAIAQEPNGELIDPYQGVADLQARILRHVSPAFVEDPVRVLRVARFAARYFQYGFRLAPETLELMKVMVGNGEVSYLVPERVWQETLKALAEPHPSVYFSVLRNCGALAEVFPELESLYGVPNPIKWHPEVDSGVHTMMVLEAAVKFSDDPMIRFAALVHDLGKAQTPAELWPKHAGHEEKSVQLIQAFAKRLAIPKDYKELAVLVGRYHGLCHKVFELKPTTIVKTLERLDCYRRPQRFFNFLLACQADHHGRTGYQDREYPQGDFWREAYQVTQQINVQDLIQQGLTGKAIAEQLHQRRVSAVNKLL